MKSTYAAFVAAIMTGSGQAQQLIQNGSFESPGFTGTNATYSQFSQGISNWTVSGTGNVLLHKTPGLGNVLSNQTFNFAQNGAYYLDLSGSGNKASIYQDFATTAATLYTLSFYIGASDNSIPAPTINVQLNGGALLNTTFTPSAPGSNINWALQTLTFTADSATTRLTFRGVSTPGVDDNASFVDSVSVVAVPEPSTFGLVMVAGLGGLLASRRRSLVK